MTYTQVAYIYTNPYEQPYLSAKQELEQRENELAMIQQRITWLKATISALEPLVNANPSPPRYGNLADLCFAVLSANPGRQMTVPEIQHVIELMGITLQYSNPGSVLHTTLRRLAGRPESPVKMTSRGVIFHGSTPTPDGPRFSWDPAVPRPAHDLKFASEM